MAAGWHDYAQATIAAMGALRLACGAGTYPDYGSALNEADIVAVCEHASRWALQHLSDTLKQAGREDLFDMTASAAAEHLAHQIASECDTARLAEAVSAPWRHNNEVSCDTFVAALKAATPPGRPPPTPAQAETAATAQLAIFSPGYAHNCDHHDDHHHDVDHVDCAACERESVHFEAITECLRWHAAPPPTADTVDVAPISPRGQAELLAEAATESYHGALLVERAHRRVSAGARAAANDEDLPGAEIAIEDMIHECDSALFVGWTFVTLWLDAHAQRTSGESVAAIVRASGDLWRSELTRTHEQTLLDRLQTQFDAPAETAHEMSAEIRDLCRTESQGILEGIRSDYGVKTASRSERRRRHR